MADIILQPIEVFHVTSHPARGVFGWQKTGGGNAARWVMRWPNTALGSVA